MNALSHRPDFDRIVSRFMAKRIAGAPSECWNWTDAPHTTGYGALAVQVNLKTQLVYAHRLSYFLKYGPIPVGADGKTLLVCHTCDNRLCVNPAHLFIGTDGDNMRDKTSKGRNFNPIGELSPTAKLSAEQVLTIRNDRRTARTIASDYGVSVVTVNEIRSNKTWSHLPHAIRRRPPRGILSAEKARAIRADNRSSASIAKDYGVTPGTIRSVKCGMIWKDA